MIGKTQLIWLTLAGVASGVLFHTSYRVQELDTRLASLNREIIREQEAIQVLKAEWSHLNEPGRIERLARGYTLLGPVEAGQVIASVEAIPFPEPELDGRALVAAAPVPGRKPGLALPVAGESRVASTEPPAPAPAPTPVATARGQVAAMPPADGFILTSFGATR